MAVDLMTLAESTRSVANGSVLLQRALRVSAVPDPLIVERLEIAARRRLGEQYSPSRQGFASDPGESGPDAASPGAAGPPVLIGGGPEDNEILAGVLADLNVGNALLAAGQALGEGAGPGEDRELTSAISALTEVADDLEHQARTGLVGAQRFEAAPASPDLPTAIDALQRQLDTTLEELARASAGVVTDALTEVYKRAPDKLTQLIEELGTQLKLGEHSRRFVQLGLATIERALAALAQLFPLTLLETAKAEIRSLAERLKEGEAAPAVLGWVIGVADVRADAERLRHQEDTTPDRLDRAVGALRALGERYSWLMKVASGIVTAIASVAGVASFVGLAIPHLVVATAGAFLLVVATVVLLGLDYTDARKALPGFVVGARSIIREAWSPV